MSRVSSSTVASVRDRIQRSASVSPASVEAVGATSIGPASAPGRASSCASTKRPMFQSLFTNRRPFSSLPSENSLSAPADTPFTSAYRSASAPCSSIMPTGLTTLPLDLLIFWLPIRTRPCRYTVWKGTAPMFSRPIIIIRATQ